MRTQITTAAPSSPQAPISLLHRIANDEEFRARLEADPVAAFAEVGVEIDPSMVPNRTRLPLSLIESAGTQDDLDLGKGVDIRWMGLLG